MGRLRSVFVVGKRCGNKCWISECWTKEFLNFWRKWCIGRAQGMRLPEGNSSMWLWIESLIYSLVLVGPASRYTGWKIEIYLSPPCFQVKCDVLAFFLLLLFSLVQPFIRIFSYHLFIRLFAISILGGLILVLSGSLHSISAFLSLFLLFLFGCAFAFDQWSVVKRKNWLVGARWEKKRRKEKREGGLEHSPPTNGLMNSPAAVPCGAPYRLWPPPIKMASTFQAGESIRNATPACPPSLSL